VNRPTIQQVQRQVAQGVIDEAKKMASSAQEQITGVPVSQSLPDHNQFDNTAAYKQELQQRENQRMAELKAIIEQEMRNAKTQREQKAQEVAQLQAQQMSEDENKDEKKGGFFASLGHAAKRMRGRLGQVGKGKMEKGRGGGG